MLVEKLPVRSIAETFFEDGYVIFDLDVPDFDDIAAHVISDLAPRYDEGHRIENAWRLSRGVKQMAILPQVLDLLEEIYGRRAFPFQTLNFDRGTQQATHSDTIHFDSTPQGFMAGVWIAYENIDAENGPLHYYPGSQKLPQLTLKDFGVPVLGDHDPYELYRSVYEPGIADLVKERRLTLQEGHMRKGQALIWSANLLHGGQPILDPARTRHSQVTHYYFEGCSYFTPLLSDSKRGMARRYPVDIRTGWNVGGFENGKPLTVPIAQRVKTLAKNALRSATTYNR